MGTCIQVEEFSHVSRWTKCISAKVTPFCTCLGARPGVVDGFIYMENTWGNLAFAKPARFS